LSAEIIAIPSYPTSFPAAVQCLCSDISIL